ncbi:MAG: hypothetical protein AAB425_16175 [Bdellovibrionota bacterium]
METRTAVLTLAGLLALAGTLDTVEAGARWRTGSDVRAPAGSRGVDAGTYEDGQAVGSKNASRIVGAIEKKTIGGRDGCRALDDYQDALVAVLRAMRAPGSEGGSAPDLSDRYVRGYLDGYLLVLRESVREARRGCEAVVFGDGGAYAAEFFGTALCRTVDWGVDALAQVQFGRFYDGWTGGDRRLHEACTLGVRESLRSCWELGDDVEDLKWFESSALAACNDTF